MTLCTDSLLADGVVACLIIMLVELLFAVMFVWVIAWLF